MTKIQIDDVVPSFQSIVLHKNSESPISEKDLKGKWSVFYFYPKDMTPGCTKEACEFRDSYKYFVDNDVNLFAISNDSIKKHKSFSEKHELPFALISDEDYSIVKAFDVYKEKSMFGKKYMGIERTTFLIDPIGKIKFKWEKVNPLGHTAKVIEKLKEFM